MSDISNLRKNLAAVLTAVEQPSDHGASKVLITLQKIALKGDLRCRNGGASMLSAVVILITNRCSVARDRDFWSFSILVVLR